MYSLETYNDKRNYLTNWFEQMYLSDILKRHNLQKDKRILENLLNRVSFFVGSLTNPTNLPNTF